MKAITWGLEVRGVAPGPWRLLMVLCSYVGKRNYDVWPSLNTMAEKAEVSRATAKRFIEVLSDAGLIVQAEERWRENGARSVNVYRILVGEIDTSDVGPDEEDQYLAEDDPRVNLNRGGSRSYDSGPRVTADPCKEPLLDRTSIIEDSPLFLTEETPPTSELPLGDQALVTAKPSLIEYVKEGWAKLCEDFPRTQGIEAWTDSRKKGIARRAAEIVRDAKGSIDAYQVWDMMFAAIRADPWLRGEGAPTDRYPIPFSMKIDYLLRASVFPGILEKAKIYEQDTRTTRDPGTGRTFGPAEQAGRDAFALFRANRERV